MPKVMPNAKLSQRRIPTMRKTAYPAKAFANGMTRTYRLNTVPVSFVNRPTNQTKIS